MTKAGEVYDYARSCAWDTGLFEGRTKCGIRTQGSKAFRRLSNTPHNTRCLFSIPSSRFAQCLS